MLVRYFEDYDGKLLEQGMVDIPLNKGEPIVLKKGKYVIVDNLPPVVDWLNNILFHPTIVKKQI
jgi:hypothetical protein